MGILTTEMITTLIILVLTAGLMVWGKIRSDIVALCSMLALVLSGVITPNEGLAGFSNSVVIMIAGLFIVGGAITQTGIATKISNYVLSLAGSKPIVLFLMVSIVTIFVGLFVSNTGTVAILMPIVISIAQKSKVSPSGFLMPMAFIASFSGMMTLIGTPPTLIVHDALKSAGYEGLKFFSTLPIGLIITVIGVAMLWPLSRKFLVKKDEQEALVDSNGTKSPEELTSEYKVVENLYRLEQSKGSKLKHKKLAELDITNRYTVSIIEIRTRHYTALGKTITVHLPEADTVISENDVLYVIGEYEHVLHFAQETGLNFLDSDQEKELERPKFQGKFKFDEIGIAEVVILNSSRLNGRQVKKSEMRENYNVNILSIQRNDQFILQGLKDEKIHAGDMLLVQGSWEDIDRMNRMESDIVVIGQPETEASKVTLDHKGPYAAVVILLMVIAMIFNWLTPVIAVLLAALAVILGGCFRSVKDAYRTINWESVILFACMMPLATAMDNTGLSALLSQTAVDSLGGYGPYVVMGGLMLLTSLLTMFISNTATAILFAPIALQAALSMGLNPYPFMIAVTVAASMCFASPFSTPPNAMVMGAGKYTFMDYVKVGLPLQVVILALMLFFIPIVFPF